MKHYSILPMMCAGLLLGCGVICSADETAGNAPQGNSGMRQGRHPGMRQGGHPGMRQNGNSASRTQQSKNFGRHQGGNDMPQPPEGMGSNDMAQPPEGMGGMKGQGGMRGMGGMMRGGDPGRLVPQELNTYMSDKSDENYQKLESAVNSAMSKDTEKRRAMLQQMIERLQKELAELDTNQQQRSQKFLDSVKSGEYKQQSRQNSRSGRQQRSNGQGKGGAAGKSAQQ